MQILWRVVAVAKTRHSRELYIWERKRVQVLSARSGTLLSSMSWCSPNLLLKLEKSQFRAHYPGFSRVLKEKIRVTAAMKLYMDDTLEEDAWFLMSWKCKTHLCKSRSGEDDFSSKCRCPRAADKEFPVCVTCCGQLHMRTVTNQTNSYSSSFSISDLKLSSTVKARVEVRVLIFPQNDWLTNLRLHGGIDIIIFFRCQKRWKPSMLSSSR